MSHPITTALLALGGALMIVAAPSDASAQCVSDYVSDCHNVTIGLEGSYAGVLTEVSAGSLGLDVGFRLVDRLAAGLGAAVASTTLLSGDRTALTALPRIEAHTALSDVLQIYGRLGAGLQVRYGGDLEPAFGLSPYVGAGARAWVGRCGGLFPKRDPFSTCFAIGPLTRLEMVVSEGFQNQVSLLPEGALIWTSGLDMLVAF